MEAGHLECERLEAAVTPEEIRQYADMRADAYAWDADTRERYRQQLTRAEQRKAEALAALAVPAPRLSTRAELADAGYGLAPAPSLATHASRTVDGRVVHPPAIAERVAEAEEADRARWAARMAHAKPFRRPDGMVIANVYELDYNVLNSVAGPT